MKSQLNHITDEQKRRVDPSRYLGKRYDVLEGRRDRNGKTYFTTIPVEIDSVMASRIAINVKRIAKRVLEG